MDQNDEIKDRLRQLELDNLRLRAELEAVKAGKKLSQKAGKFLTQSSSRILVGRGLKSSLRRLLDELPGKPSKETLADVTAHLIWRITRIGLFALIVAAAPLMVMIIQTVMLNRQNDKLEVQNTLLGRQNERLDQQINLEEGNRRSSLIFFMSNIMDRIDDEVKDDPRRVLSDPLIGRIVSLSQALRPYRYLENDELTPRQLSPERGQLLFSLINSNLDQQTYDKIYARANFSYADLREANFSGAYLRQANLANSYFSKANFNNANLENADLSNAWLEEATFRKTRLSGINLTGANLRKSRMEDITMINGNLANADLREIYLKGDFSGTNLGNIKIQKATLVDVNLEGCYFKSSAWIDSLPYYDLKGLAFVVDIYEQKKEARREGFAIDTVIALRTDPNSQLAQMRLCNELVQHIVESAPKVQELLRKSRTTSRELALYATRNPFGMAELGIEKDTSWLYRLAAYEEDLTSTVMWVKFDPQYASLWEIFPEAEKVPSPLAFDKNLLKNLSARCQTQ